MSRTASSTGHSRAGRGTGAGPSATKAQAPSPEALLARERALRLEAEEANRIKDEFLATLSHELRTPLNAIVGWAHLLKNAQLGPVERTRAVETIMRNAQLQAGLIEDLLDVSRIITGKLRLGLDRVDVAQVLEGAMEGARPAADARFTALSLEVAPDVGSVMADPARLQQVVWNLLSNAIKFTPEHGRVDLTAARAGAHVVIEVRDTGQGIRAELLPHIFERFRQGDGGAARAQGGLGLGLAIVRHLVEAHGGRVHAQSEGEGKGARFTVELPAAQPGRRRGPRPQPERPVLAEDELAGAHVLVVDDQQDARDLLEEMLKRRGVQVLTAASAAEALEMLRTRPVDVLVCDIGMPGTDGYGFLRQLRASGEDKGGWVPALALTAHAGRDAAREALLAGFQMHVSKPLDPTRLLESIARLRRRGTRDGGREQ